jgi:hypothetical protein
LKLADTNPTRTQPTDKGHRPRVLQRKLETWERQWAEIRRIANELHNAGETILAAGDQTTADAYPTSTRPGQGQVAGDHPDPTLANVEHKAGGTYDEPTNTTTPDEWQPSPDVVAEWIREIQLTTYEVLGHMRRVRRLADMIKKRDDPRITDRGGLCQACEREVTGDANDRLRSGYCDSMARNQPRGGSCYRAWLEWRKPYLDRGEEASHQLFQLARREQLDQMFATQHD